MVCLVSSSAADPATTNKGMVKLTGSYGKGRSSMRWGLRVAWPVLAAQINPIGRKTVETETMRRWRKRMRTTYLDPYFDTTKRLFDNPMEQTWIMVQLTTAKMI